MRNNTSRSLIAWILSASIIISSCQKSIDKPADLNEIASAANSANANNQGVKPYKFERINEHNFFSQGCKYYFRGYYFF
jgi:hypothetical protein